VSWKQQDKFIVLTLWGEKVTITYIDKFTFCNSNI
jgi:hypothetical protein